jgi:uncharacterized protein YbjQ (UPF0145 family)
VRKEPPGIWGSTLTCGEFAAVRSAGFEAVGQVFGAAVYAAGAASGYSCSGSRASPADPLVRAMYQAGHTAIDRMTAECAELGGHGVVGVRLSWGSFRLGGLEFTAIGTAVRAPGAVYRWGPFTCDLSGQDFAKLITMGWVPAGLALGISIEYRHDDGTTVRQARWGSGNTEVTGWTELVSRARHDAGRRLETDVSRFGADGAVIAAMQLRVSQRDCPASVGRRDHIVEATVVGTAIARFSGAGQRYPGPGHPGPGYSGPGYSGPGHAGSALAVMSLNPRRLL